LLPDFARINRTSKIDSFLGKLSFPIYLIHFLVIQIATTLQMLVFSRSNSYLTCLVTLISSFLFSILANKYLLDPIDEVRARLKSKVN
jgi:peptidoglycan/LPS O-acetylase OafA/YrhL